MNRDQPYNDLPLLPPAVELDNPKLLKKAIAANRRLAELKGTVLSIPNPSLLLDSIILQEAKNSSEIENIVTTNDVLYRAAADEKLANNPQAKEILRYRQALRYGLEALYVKPLATNLFIDIATIIKAREMEIRKVPGTKIANQQRIIYTPPEGEQVIRDKLANLERFMHEKDEIDPLIKLAILHYQFEAIHPFTDGNGRTGRIINILFLIENKLLNNPILFLSHYILKNKTTYYQRLRGVTETSAWTDWIYYMLDAIETTARETQERINDILLAMLEARVLLQTKAPKIYSKDLIEVIFIHPYCKARFLEYANIAKRQTAATYLKQLEALGLLREEKLGREKYYINTKLLQILSK